MSIFVKGMKMPKYCQQCPCAYWVSQFAFLGCNVKPGKRYAMRDEKYRNSSTRPEWCPLVEVPTPHGRLIDADEFRGEVKDKQDDCAEWRNETEDADIKERAEGALSAFIECKLTLDKAPTIIEAEE